MVTLDPAAESVLEAIERAPEAWSVWDDLARRWPGALEQLEGAGLVERWERPDYRAVTLTPWGAACRGVWIAERVHWVTRDVRELGEPHRCRVAEVYPVWVGHEVELDDCDPPPAHMGRLFFPDRVVDHRTPLYLCDDDGEPVTILGQPVPVDRRIRGKRQGRTRERRNRLG